jgi:thioredoxin 1
MDETKAPVHVTDGDFEKTVLNSSIPVLVDFWAAWCGPCRMIAPYVEELAKDYGEKVLIAKMDTDANPQVQGWQRS